MEAVPMDPRSGTPPIHSSPCLLHRHVVKFMEPRFAKQRLGFAILLMLAVVRPSAVRSESLDSKPIDYARDIQPILATHCWSCHGPDERSRQADLRFDSREIAISTAAIVPNKPQESGLVERIHATEPDRMMPPPETKKPLSDRQKELLRQWIEQGAPYSAHWAFATPSLPKVPEVTGGVRTHSPIDAFVRERLLREGLSSSPAADRGTLLRRVTLDLTGLPPTPEQLQAFENDPSPTAYETVVDRLLASESYAEKMAAQWLDLARYADTNGYNNDEDRTMWPWRDWVIAAFHANMPYDQFLTEQLAGDMLPSPSRSQLVASGFLRNQGHNTEGGIIQEEYRVEYVADRLHTTATVFLGLSMQCARCHDHKYDPITQAEYFQFFAMLNNLDEKQASYSKFVAAEPFIRVPSESQEIELAQLDQDLANLQKQILERESASAKKFQEWLSSQSDAQLIEQLGCRELYFSHLDSVEEGAIPSGSVQTVEGKFGTALGFDGNSHLVLGDQGGFDGDHPFSISGWIYPTSDQGMAVLSRMDESAAYRGYDLLVVNGKLESHLVHQWPGNAIKVVSQKTVSNNAWHHVVLTYDGSKRGAGVKLYIDGQMSPLDIPTNALSGSIATDSGKPFHLGRRETTLPFHGRIDEVKIVSGELTAQDVAQLHAGNPITQVTEWIRKPIAEQTPEQQGMLKQFGLKQTDPDFGQLLNARDQKQKQRNTFADEFPAVMVMREMQPPRETFLLKRGQYDQPGDKVNAGVPQVLSSFSDVKPANRLELARWLVHPSHPLTARVAVNRLWENLFGTGLVRTTEDFGVTGELPSHPELLDYLAVTFVQSGWDIKALLKQIVMSDTYRQESRIGAEQLSRDPENRWLGRGPRYRLSAETIRDNALAISGLLQPRVGGPSVKPYQPDGLWEDVTVERRGKYVPDRGEGAYRRSMYTFWKRTCPPPSMVSFDAPNREVCVARRSRTNTPLQALVLLNDPTYIEASRSLAMRVLRSGLPGDTEKVHAMYRASLSRNAREEEMAVISDLIAESRDRFTQSAESAAKLNQSGAVVVDSSLDANEVAVWTVIASAILNLDETITKR